MKQLKCSALTINLVGETLSFGTFLRFHIEHFVSTEVNSKPRQVVGPGMHRGFSAFPLASVVLVLLLLQRK